MAKVPDAQIYLDVEDGLKPRFIPEHKEDILGILKYTQGSEL